MADPQVEDGFVRFSNELFEAFARTNICGESRRVLDVIIRKTYGFNKKWDAISLSQFSEKTGMKTQNVVRALKKLLKMNMIIKDSSGYISSYCVQKDYDKWGETTLQMDSIQTEYNQDTPKSTLQMDSETTLQMDSHNRHVLKTTKDRDLKKSKKPKKPFPDTGFSL